MIFLIEYDRAAGKLASITPFADECRQQAAEARLTLELALNKSRVEREVVLLEAQDETALRRTHQRYFESLAGILAGSELMSAAATGPIN